MVNGRGGHGRVIEQPRSVPMIVEITTATIAIRRVTNSASSTWSLPNSAGYHSSVKPFQTIDRFESLKLKMMRITIGANRNA